MAAAFVDVPDTTSAAERAIVVSGIPYVTKDSDELNDYLTIYFGKRKNGGGDVEQVITPFGGTLRKALVVFESSAVVAKILYRKHELEDQPITVHALPPVYSEIQGVIDPFYSSSLTKLASEALIAQLQKRFGSGKPGWVKNKLSSVTGSTEYLREVEHMILLTSLKLVSTYANEGTSGILERSVKMENITYVTDDNEQLKEELCIYFKGKNRVEVEELICPISGNMRSAVAVFRNTSERDRFLHDGDHSFFNEIMSVEKLPQVFHEVISSVDEFYFETTCKDNWKKTLRLMQNHCGSKFTEAGREIHGTLDDTVEAATYILTASGLLKSEEEKEKAVSDVKRSMDSEDLEQKKHDSTDEDSLMTIPADSNYEKRSKSMSSRKIPIVDSNDSRRYTVSGESNQTTVVQTAGMHSKEDDRNNVHLVEDHFKFSQSGATTNVPRNMPEITVPKQKSVKQQRENKMERRDDDQLDDPSTNRKKSRQTASSDSAQSENWFITVDAITYKYMEEKCKKDIRDLEKKYNVKVKPSPSTPLEEGADQLYIELQTKSRRTNKATKSIDIPAAQAEFTRLYGDVFSNTKKEVITFKNLLKKEIKKAEDRLKKYQNMVSIWDDDGCTLFGEDAMVESAAEELRSALSGYESMTVDRIAFKYLSTVHNDQLDLLKAKYNVTLDVQTAATEDQQTVLVKPIRKKKKKCTSQELSDAKDEFITLYQQIFFSTKRTAVKCPGISEEVIKDAVKLTKEKHANMCGVNGTISDEVILCTEESIHDIVVREFRKLVGVAPKRRLRKTPSSDMEETKNTNKQSKADEDGVKVKNTLPSVFITKESMIIRAITDDLTKQTTDVIVNTANPTLSFDGGVSKAISTAAGPGMQRECKAILRGHHLGVGDCVSSNSFNLSCKRVIHVVGPRYERNKDEVFGNNLTKTVSNVLSMNEDELCTKSIALPLISSGNLGGPKEYCAKKLVSALYDFSKNHVNRHLREVVLVNIEVETTRILQDVCAEVFQVWHQSSDNNDEKTQTPPNPISHYKTNKGIDIFIESGNITHAQVDVIVNAANTRLKHGRGVAGALSKAAGKELQNECDTIMSRRPALKTGEYVVTSGYRLNARILHTVGPIYQEYSSDREFYQALTDTFIAAIRHANIPIEAKSIAIPLVSSGIYGGPKQICADALLEAVEEFDKERNIVLEKIVLINLDAEATQALHRAFSKRYSGYVDHTLPGNKQAEMGIEKDHARHTTGSGIQLYVIEDDITKQKVDAIVNSTDEYLRHTIGVAKAISAAAGDKLQEKCRDIMRARRQRGRGQGPLRADEFIETKGFNLNAKYILHTCTPIFTEVMIDEYRNMLRQKFEQCLLEANKKGDVSSIALPLMGAGNVGAPKDVCADALAKAIEAFEVNEKHINLKCIVLVSNDKDAIGAVEKAFDRYFRHHHVNHKGTVSRTSVSDANTWNQGSYDTSYVRKPTPRAGESSHNAGYQTRNRDGHQQQVPIYHGAENPLHPGAIPKNENSSWSIVSQQEVSNIQHSQPSSVIGDYLVNPLKTFFGYNEKPVTDMTRKSPTSSIHPSSMTSGDNRQESNLVGHVDAEKSLDTSTKCLNCGVNYDLHLLGGCNHTFCKQCITKEIVPKSKCSACGTLFSIAEEGELGGTMTYYTRSNLALPGESANGAIEIIFEFPDGTVQASEQHNGIRYKGNMFIAYLPNNADGLEVALLLKTAFCQGLMSRLRMSKRSSPKLMLSDLIPLKSNFKGGLKNDGYPDPDYLSRVKDALREHHIVSSLSSDV